jgi:hypothetical protein
VFFKYPGNDSFFINQDDDDDCSSGGDDPDDDSSNCHKQNTGTFHDMKK